MASIVRPNALRPGDVVAVAALSNELVEDEVSLFDRGVAMIESLGFRVRVSPLAQPGRSYWWSVARPDETATELNRLLRDPEIRGIVALDGGRWVLSYLDRIDLDAIRSDPKPWVRATPRLSCWPSIPGSDSLASTAPSCYASSPSSRNSIPIDESSSATPTVVC